MLPDLVETVCEACSGTGVDDYVIVGTEVWPEGCPECDGRGVKSVCGICGITPDAFTDVCECDPEVLWGASIGWVEAA